MRGRGSPQDLRDHGHAARIKHQHVPRSRDSTCGTQKASAGEPSEVLQMKMVAGTGFEPVTFRL